MSAKVGMIAAEFVAVLPAVEFVAVNIVAGTAAAAAAAGIAAAGGGGIAAAAGVHTAVAVRTHFAVGVVDIDVVRVADVGSIASVGDTAEDTAEASSFPSLSGKLVQCGRRSNLGAACWGTSPLRPQPLPHTQWVVLK